MATVSVRSGRKVVNRLDAADVEKLRASFRGTLLEPGVPGYDQARSIWNSMIDRKPALIAQCAGVADVQAAINYAREHNMLISIKGGGHNIAGNAVCDGGVMIDFTRMRSVRIDPIARVAHVDPGATLGDFDHEAQAFGLATPLGINSTTGVAGLTLGGGFGWLTRKYGMTVDNLTAVDVVTADGLFLTANETQHPELFWAIRGGGGNFGVITRFEFKLHKVGPTVLGGLVVYSMNEATEVLKKYRQFVKTLPTTTNIWVVMRLAPPLPFLPAETHGKPIIALAVFHNGDPSEGQKLLEPTKSWGKVLGEFIGEMPYTAWQKMFDPLLTPGARNYWKSHNFAELSDGLIDIAVKQVGKLPLPQCEIFFGYIEGEANRRAKDATAYPHRDAAYAMNIHGRWDKPEEDAAGIAWTRESCKSMDSFATGGVYVNFLTEDESDRIKSAFGPSYDRLIAAKRKYDPENLFCMNMNIDPKG